MEDYFLLCETILHYDHAIALKFSRMFFNDILIDNTKFCVNQEGFSTILLKFVCQNMRKFFNCSCFSWRHEIRPVGVNLVLIKRITCVLLMYV